MNQSHIVSLLQAIPLPAVLIGRGERILGANSGACALLGEGLSGRHFITAIRQPSVLDAVETCLRDHVSRQTRYLGSERGQDTTYRVSCSHVDIEIGKAVLVCFEDITQLEQAGQMRRDFVANVSHELRSPLTSLLGFIETLRGPARGDVEASERFLATMQTEASRMERLVKDLLSLSRVEAQERVRPTDPVDLNRLLGSVQHAMRPIADESRVTLDLALPEAPVVIDGDPDQLQQVVTNLIENAIKYGGPDKRVRITLSTGENDSALRGPSATICVRDEGPGIDPVHLPRLTERFYRVDSHRSRAMGGTGLGLAIVKHIVNRHRGRLRILSEPGEGSEFRLVLPCAAG